MAFPTTQSIDAVLLNNLLFRNTVNTPISSYYTLYANGKGQTYWSNAVQPNDISTLSSAITPLYSTLSNEIDGLQSSFTLFSTNTYTSSISTLNRQLISTFAQLNANYNILTVQFNTLSNNVNNNFTTLSNNLTNQVNSTISTTIGVVTSTISGISSISSFTNEFLSTQQLFASSASTLSTAIYLEGLNVFSSISSIVSTSASQTLSSAFAYTDIRFSTLSSFLITSTQINELSTQQGFALLGYTSTILSTISTGIGSLSSQIYSFEQSTFSTQTWMISTLSGVNANIQPLLTLSTQISSIIYNQVVSFTLPIFQQQDIKFSQYTSTLLSEISTLSTTTSQNTQEIDYISTFTYESISSIEATNTVIFGLISTLDREFSIITTSSILVDIYDSFYDLSTYTSLLIQSTVNTMIPFKSTVFYSTSVQNTSSGVGYFNAYVNSVYTSTISTMIPITSSFVSSLILNIYSTGTFALLSSIDSTIFGKSNEFQSTNSSFTNALLLSSVTQFNSSILGYLSTPAGNQLNLFSTNSFIAISTFQGQGLSTLVNQSTVFGASFASNQLAFSTQNQIGNSIVSTLSTSFIQYSSTFSGLFQAIQISSVNQLTTQNTQFISSMNSYQFQFNSTITSTTTAVVTQTTSTATRILNNITSSTNTIYNNFVTSLNAAASVNLSTLFTSQTITLSGTNFQGTLDFGGFTNFTVNVRSPLVSGSSNYRITYNSNQIANLNYRRGFITVDVSTVTTGYSNNSGRLCLDTYRWGLPTTIYNEFYPSISSADYTSVYSYTILNNIVYTNLLNVFPRLRVNALNITTPTNTGVSGSYWRGSPVTVNWSNYSFFPLNAIGAPAFTSEVLVDVVLSNTVISRYGPFPLSISTTSVMLPYVTGVVANPQTALIRSYIVGKPMDAFETPVSIIMPQLFSLSITNAPSKFLALNEVSAFSDAGVNTFSGLSQIFSYDGTGTSNAFFATYYRIMFGGGSISINSDPDFALPGDFTIEWIQTLFNTSAFQPIFTTATSEINFSWSASRVPTLTFGGSVYTWTAESAAALAYPAWMHVAISRQGSTIRLFINGVAKSSTHSNSASITNTANLVIGRIGTFFFNGAIGSFRWIKGEAIYTSDFTAPRTALTTIPNTRFLLNPYTATPDDISGTGKVVTNVGTVTTQVSTDYFLTGYSKNSLVDGNPSTFFASATRQGVPATNSQLVFQPALGTSQTSISSIVIDNISSVSSFLRAYNPAINDSQELQGATMVLTTSIGAQTYTSTITLTSSIRQIFSI